MEYDIVSTAARTQHDCSKDKRKKMNDRDVIWSHLKSKTNEWMNEWRDAGDDDNATTQNKKHKVKIKKEKQKYFQTVSACTPTTQIQWNLD